MAIPLTGIVGDLSNLVPSGSDLLQQIILGAGASVVLSGLKTAGGQEAIDPLHFFHKPAVEATPTTPATPATSSVVVGKTVMGSVFATLTPAIQDRMMSQGYTVVAG